MTQTLIQIEYRRGMLTMGMVPEILPVTVWREAEIPADVCEAVVEENLLDLGGVHGDQAFGYPVQYDHLLLRLANDSVEITVYNLAIMLFCADDERMRRIHRVLYKLDDWREA